MTTIKGSSTDIIVAGGGPAGCTVAVGLRKLGYRVALVHSPRPWQTWRGYIHAHPRGLDSGAGLFEAVATVPSASPRNVCWNGESSTANTEHLVLRQHFDAALLADAAAGAELIPGRVRQLEDTAEGAPCLHLDTPAANRKFCTAAFSWMPAAALPRDGTSQLRGPETVSLLQLRQGH